MWVAELTDEAQYASTLKKLQSCCTLGGLCMSPLPGLLADATGSYTGYYLFCAAATLLSLLLVNGVYKNSGGSCMTRDRSLQSEKVSPLL